MPTNQFAVTHATWLKTEGDRIQAIILMPKFWGARWTHPKLRQALAALGLNYSAEQIAELNDEMHKRGIVEDVTAPVPEPLPE